jgi:hypothetical protein
VSETEVEKLMEQMDRWDAKHAKHEFIARMEKKLHRKERQNRS